MDRAARRTANTLLAAYGLTPLKERRSPRPRTDRYLVTTWLENGDQWGVIPCETLVLARAQARHALRSTTGIGININVADIAPVGDPDNPTELYALRGGKIVKK